MKVRCFQAVGFKHQPARPYIGAACRSYMKNLQQVRNDFKDVTAGQTALALASTARAGAAPAGELFAWGTGDAGQLGGAVQTMTPA